MLVFFRRNEDKLGAIEHKDKINIFELQSSRIRIVCHLFPLKMILPVLVRSLVLVLSRSTQAKFQSPNSLFKPGLAGKLSLYSIYSQSTFSSPIRCGCRHDACSVLPMALQGVFRWSM